jgi:hypothetical protein
MGEDSAWEPIGSLPEFKALLDAQSAAPIPDQNAAPPAPPPKKKHTLRNALIGTAAIVILIVWAANSGQNSPGGGASTQNGNAHSPGGGRDSRVIARYYGTMARAGESLPIRLSWGGIVNGEAVNTSYLYTKYNIPITLNGFVSKDGVLYLEENNESGGVFAFENFKEGAGVLPGIWFTPHDSSKVYEVTLTKE